MTKDQPNSLEQHRVAMKEALEAGGAQAVIAYVGAFDSDPLRRVLCIASRQVLVGTHLDDLITVADAGVAEMLRQAYEAATKAFEAQLADSASAVEAKLGLGQLQVTLERHGP